MATPFASAGTATRAVPARVSPTASLVAARARTVATASISRPYLRGAPSSGRSRVTPSPAYAGLRPTSASGGATAPDAQVCIFGSISITSPSCPGATGAIAASGYVTVQVVVTGPTATCATHGPVTVSSFRFPSPVPFGTITTPGTPGRPDGVVPSTTRRTCAARCRTPTISRSCTALVSRNVPYAAPKGRGVPSVPSFCGVATIPGTV